MPITYDQSLRKIKIDADPGADGVLKLKGIATYTDVLTPQIDWQSRISGTGVVWYHNFDAAAEVNQFRWSGGYQSGNDPLSRGGNGADVQWISSGGADGGGFLRLYYPGGGVGGGGSYWWRPMAPLNAASTGRGTADPAANSTLTLRPFTVFDGSGTMYNWAVPGSGPSNPGWYGSLTDIAANPTKYDGNDFYYQVRIRRAQTPGAPPNSSGYTNITGKSTWFTASYSTYTPMELVTYGQSVGNGDVVGVQSRHNVYRGDNFTSIGQGLSDQTATINNNTLGWRYSGGWDTLLYHVTPGTNGGTGANRTRIEVWAQHDLTLFPAEAGLMTKIWDVTYVGAFNSGVQDDTGNVAYPGWNAVICAIYHNGSPFTTAFQYDYDQIIFSKATIAAPRI